HMVWPLLLCVLAGCSPYQAGSGNTPKSSAQSEPLPSALEGKKTVDGAGGDAVKGVTTVPVPEGGRPVVARADAGGTIHLLYNSADGPKYVKSSDNGKTFGTPIAVVDAASRKRGLVFEGWDMAVGKGNRVHVAMGTNAWKLKLP